MSDKEISSEELFELHLKLSKELSQNKVDSFPKSVREVLLEVNSTDTGTGGYLEDRCLEALTELDEWLKS